jgi:uncharacterized protein
MRQGRRSLKTWDFCHIVWAGKSMTPKCPSTLFDADGGCAGLCMVAALDIGTEPPVLELERSQCVDLLRTVRVARVVLSVGCIPFALPVNIAVHDGDVIFATDGGSRLTSTVYGQVVSVEADEIDLASHRGWSVLVTGIAQRVTRPEELECAAPLIQAWVSEPRPMLVRVPSTLISGRWLLWGA